MQSRPPSAADQWGMARPKNGQDPILPIRDGSACRDEIPDSIDRTRYPYVAEAGAVSSGFTRTVPDTMLLDREIRWHGPRLSLDGEVSHGKEIWKSFWDNPPITLIECVR
jgi:hypothetical protein